MMGKGLSYIKDSGDFVNKIGIPNMLFWLHLMLRRYTLEFLNILD